MKERYSKELIIDCLDKLDGLNEMSWDDILDKYDLDISSSHLRKMAYGFRAYRDSFGNGTDEEFEEKMLKLRTEKVKVQDLKTLANREIRNLARVSTVVDLIKDEINYLADEKPMLNEFHMSKETSHKDGVLLLGDWHFGMTCDNSVNKYDIDICKDRINKVVDKTIENGLKNEIDKLHIVCLGDILSGTIHNTIQRANQEEISQQIVLASELLSEVIAKLSNYFYCTITMTQGNHEAVDMNKNDRTNKNNYNSLVKEFVKIRIKGLSNVVFLDNTINNDEIGILTVKNETLICCHGDKINKMKANYQLEMATGVKPSIVCYGHVHNPQYYSLYQTDVYVNGSLMSSDEYSMNKKLYTPASQTMLIINEDGVETSYIMKVQ